LRSVQLVKSLDGGRNHLGSLLPAKAEPNGLADGCIIQASCAEDMTGFTTRTDERTLSTTSTVSGSEVDDAPLRSSSSNGIHHMQILTDIDSLEPYYGWSCVPTMGALHDGHRSLIRQAVATERPAVVTIFVNPKQFAPGEDYATYPRNLDRDLDIARDEGAAAVFTPAVDDIYPDNGDVWEPPLPAVANGPLLEDAYRPHFFAGVCTVVARLFDLLQPGECFFGEKDWQQLQVIRALANSHAERWPHLSVTAGQTIREPDGLAMSSRNVYIADDQRDRALAISQALSLADQGEMAMRQLLLSANLDVDYAVVRDAETLLDAEEHRPQRALIAATLDGTRLIDNAVV